MQHFIKILNTFSPLQIVLFILLSILFIIFCWYKCNSESTEKKQNEQKSPKKPINPTKEPIEPINPTKESINPTKESINQTKESIKKSKKRRNEQLKEISKISNEVDSIFKMFLSFREELETKKEEITKDRIQKEYRKFDELFVQMMLKLDAIQSNSEQVRKKRKEQIIKIQKHLELVDALLKT